MSSARIVLVGGGVAAAATAAGLRAKGFDGPITLVGDEPEPPYERPPLSKEFLAGGLRTEDIAARPPTWYLDNDVELRIGTRVTALDVDRRRVATETGEQLPYGTLVLATGLSPRRLPGFAGEGVHYLRTAADAHGLRTRLASARHVAILGAGFIGCEVAATAIGLGKQVTIFEPATAPLAPALGAAIGTVLMDIHRARGVDVRIGQTATSLARTDDRLVLDTDRGDHLECDLVLVGIGAVPNSELAQRAGLAVGNGILVDEYGRTSAPDVYAIGDVAARHHPRYGQRIRVEHHDNALRQGLNLAANLTGTDEPYSEPHWFWSDQYEYSLQSVGRAIDLDDLVVRGSFDRREFSAFSVAEGRITAVISLNRPADVLAARRLVFAEHTVTIDELRDETLPLKRLVPRRSPAGAPR
ncbi:MAG TPA: FAD-dependent oxidoreductase [Pseudonocardiaceae bacterium]